MGYLPNIYPTFQHWSKQSVWIYSDPHFSDEDLQSGIKNRPSDEEHIKMINSCAGRKDTLIILGDVGNIECVRKLHAGYKVLIMGNHDTGYTKYKRQTHHRIFDIKKFTQQEAIKEMSKEYPNWSIYTTFLDKKFINAPDNYWYITADNKLFDEVYEGALIVGEKLIFSHEPINNIPWAMNIHGHVHSKCAKNDMYHINVCSDVINYKPLNLNVFLKHSGLLAKIDSIHRITIDKATNDKHKKENNICH